MRISTRLAIAAVVPALMVLAVATGLFVSYNYVRSLQEEQAIATSVSSDLNEMNDLARSYVFRHQERVLNQFLIKQRQALREIREAEPTSREQEQLVQSIERDIVLMKELFLAIEANHDDGETEHEDPLYLEAEERLAAQLFIRSRDANASASRWSTGLSRQIVTAQQRIYIFDLAFMSLVGLVLTIGLIGLHRVIRASLRELKMGTERIGSGDLDYRIGMTQSDELGDLGRSFDHMTERLQEVTVSKDELEREVEERKRAQQAEERAARSSTALAEVSLLLASSPLLDESLPEVLDAVMQRLSAVGVVLSERVPGGWKTRSAVGVPGERPGAVVDDDNAPARTKARMTHEPYLLSDVADDPEVDRELARRGGYQSYVAYPLVLRDEVVASLLVYFAEPIEELGMLESDFLDRLAYILSLSLENERLFIAEKRRRRRVEDLHQVTEVAVSSLDPRSVAQGVVDYLVANGYQYLSVWMARGEELECLASGNYPAELRERFPSIAIPSDQPVARVYRSDEPIVVREPDAIESDVAEAHAALGLPIGSYVIVPVRSRGRTIGALQFGWRVAREILEEDLRFYTSLGSELGVVLENARLYETEHDIAERLQSALLSLPAEVEGVEFAHAYHSASESARVGGDFYDLFDIDDARVGITIGDVAGKGLNAAVLTSLVKNTVRAHAMEKARTPAKILELANDVVYRATAPESFVTVFFGVLDRFDGTLLYANGGHTTAIITNAEGGTRRLESSGPMLGAFEGLRYDQAEACCLGEEHMLFLYTDGLVEARRDGEQYGEDRLIELLEAHAGGSPTGLIETIIEDVLTFTSMRLRDDLALLAIRRVPTANQVQQQRLEL